MSHLQWSLIFIVVGFLLGLLFLYIFGGNKKTEKLKEKQVKKNSLGSSMCNWIFIIPGNFSCNAQRGVDVPPHWKFSYFMGCSSKEKPPVHRSLLREAWKIAILWRLNIFNPCNFHTVIFDLWTMLFISKYWPIKMTLRTLRIFFKRLNLPETTIDITSGWWFQIICKLSVLYTMMMSKMNITIIFRKDVLLSMNQCIFQSLNSMIRI